MNLITFSLTNLLSNQQELTIASVMQSNDVLNRFGINLTQTQAANLSLVQQRSLKEYGRVEFGVGTIHKLAFAFCDSFYVNTDDFEELLEKLIDIFYYFKQKREINFSDDDLINQMRLIYDYKHGSLELLQDTSIKQILYNIAFGTIGEEENSNRAATDDNKEEEEWG